MYDLYQCNSNDTARYILGKSGAKKLFVVGLNPSTANQLKPDITVTKVERAALMHGFDGFVMTNLYPLRCTQPWRLPKRRNTAMFEQNIQTITDFAKSEPKPVFWAAWGGDINLRPYLLDGFKTVNRVVESLNGRWVKFGSLRSNGHPRHPSRLSYRWNFTDFDVPGYLNILA